MFKGKGNGTSTSGRAQAKGRAELQRQVEQRLGYWRLFLEAKLQEVEERRNPAGLADAPVQRVGAAARTSAALRSPVAAPTLEHDGGAALDPTTLLDVEAA